MDEKFDLQEYMTRGVEKIVSDSMKAVLKDPRESAFMLKFAAASRKASKRRAQLEKEGEHIPPFLIASITSSCNLHCAGYYFSGVYKRHLYGRRLSGTVRPLPQSDPGHEHRGLPRGNRQTPR